MAGGPWFANVANNPNINRDPPPPPLNALPVSALPTGHRVVVEQQHHHQQAPVYGPSLPIGIGGPGIGIAPPFGVGFGLGAFPPCPPHLAPFGLPAAMDPALFGMAHGMQGPLAPIRPGSFMPNSQYGIGYGLHGTGGVQFPPPPPGAVGGSLQPFAHPFPAWSSGGGLAFGNVPAVAAGFGGIFAGGGMPGMMGMGLGNNNTMHTRPAPMVHDGNMGFPAQPEQQEFTQIAGGIPPGVTLVESAEHTIIVNLKSSVAPWLNSTPMFGAEHLAFASTTGLNRLIQVCNGGLPADECENMAITECLELGSGLWEKGQTFKYNDAVSRVLTMKDAGWDNTRNRIGGNSLHIWGHIL